MIVYSNPFEEIQIREKENILQSENIESYVDFVSGMYRVIFENELIMSFDTLDQANELLLELFSEDNIPLMTQDMVVKVKGD